MKVQNGLLLNHFLFHSLYFCTTGSKIPTFQHITYSSLNFNCCFCIRKRFSLWYISFVAHDIQRYCLCLIRRSVDLWRMINIYQILYEYQMMKDDCAMWSIIFFLLFLLSSQTFGFTPRSWSPDLRHRCHFWKRPQMVMFKAARGGRQRERKTTLSSSFNNY